MIAQQSKHQSLTPNPEIKTNEEQDSRSEMMTTQTMLNGKLNQVNNGQHATDFASVMDEVSSRWANLTARLSQVFWRVSFEVEPLVGGLFSPFTAQIRRCRGLSERDQAELESLMEKH